MIKNTSYYYVEKMNEYLSFKQKENPKYSLRAYASYLGINPGTLSAILSGKRLLPEAIVQEVGKKIELNEIEESRFKESVLTQNIAVDKAQRIDSSIFKCLFEEWEYFVVLGVMRIKSFDGTVEWIANKMDISLERTNECINNLITWGLVEKNAVDMLSRVHHSLYSQHDIPSEVIRNAHFLSLKIANEKLEVVPVENRDYSFSTLSLDERGFKQVKKKLLKLRSDLHAIGETVSDENEKVYRLSVQLFPMTK